MQNILIVCTGNICRSPMAEALLRKNLLERRPDISISSAGVSALVGHQPELFARQVMEEKRAIDISSHRARQVTCEILLEADLVLVMEKAQKNWIERQWPSLCGRVHCLGKWENIDIPDPHRCPRPVFEQTLDVIEQCLNDWCKQLWK